MMNRVETWRRNASSRQRAVAELIGATDAVVVRGPKKASPIRGEFIDAYVRAASGFLLETDFIEAATHKGHTNGNTQKGRGKGRNADAR
jgi:hypothetical protein